MVRADRTLSKSYDLDMTTEQLAKAHTARPFRPFTICLGDGQRLPVQHPEMLASAPKGRTATVYRNDDTCEFIDLLLVTGLDMHRPMSGAKRKHS